MICKLAYLTTPAPNVFVLNVQPDGEDGILRFEITKAHLANILIAGTAVALRDSSNRVPVIINTEETHGDDRRQQPA